MKMKSRSSNSVAHTSLLSYFKQYGYYIRVIHSDHESALISAASFFKQQGIQYHTITPCQHEQNLKDMLRQSMLDLSSLKNKLYAQLFVAILKYLNILPNSSVYIQGYKLDVNPQPPIPFGIFSALHYAKLSINMSLNHQGITK